MEDLDYVHILDGRLRVKVPEVKRSRSKAILVERVLRRMRGVTHVKANPLTGNVLVLFRPQQLDVTGILAALRGLDCFSQKAASPQWHSRVSQFVVKSVAEIVFERAILALL
jgi:hypothetical protein